MNSTSVELKIKEAISLGAKNIIVLDANVHSNKFLMSLWLKFQKKTFKKGFLEDLKLRESLIIPDNINIIHLKPTQKPVVSLLDNDKTHLKQTWEDGYYQTAKNTSLKLFLQ